MALLADAIAAGFTGWLFTTDRFWGVAWVEELHSALGSAVPTAGLRFGLSRPQRQ